MVKITTKEKDDVQARNVAKVFGKDSVICVSRKNSKNILHIAFTFTIKQVNLIRNTLQECKDIKPSYKEKMLIRKQKTWAALCAMGRIAD